MADLVRSERIANTLVAFDRDYDIFFGVAIDSPRILYTLGYSWENDVWTIASIKNLFYSITGACNTSVDIDAELNAIYKQFYARISKVIRADIICNAHAIELIPKQQVHRILCLARNVAPALSKSAVKQCFKEAKMRRASKLKLGRAVKVDPHYDCHGHLAAAFGVSVLTYFVRKYARSKSLPSDLLSNWAIDVFGQRLAHPGRDPVRAHYKCQLEKVIGKRKHSRARAHHA